MSKEAPPWMTRAVEELAQTKGRIEKLKIFMTGPFFKTVADMDQSDLKHQLTAMEDYAYYLERRVNRHK